MLRRCCVTACLPTGAAAVFSPDRPADMPSYTKQTTPFRSNRTRIELHNTAVPHRQMTVADLPGPIGSFSKARQAVGVASFATEAAGVQEVTVFDFAFTCGASEGEINGFPNKDMATTAKRVCTFTLPFKPVGTRVVYHTLTQHSAHIAYHNLPSMAATPAARAAGDMEDETAYPTRTGTAWPAPEGSAADTDLFEVRDWDTAVHLDVESIVPAGGNGRFLVVASTADIVSNPIRQKDPEPLRVNPFLGKEELLLAAFRRQTLLLQDFNHEARVTLAWWYARKYGRDNARQMFAANVLNYLRAHDAEGMYNVTELEALLHLVSCKMLDTPQHTSMDAFLTSHPELADAKCLLQYYSPEVLRARGARIAFVEPDLRSLPGVGYPDAIAEAITNHGPWVHGDKLTSRSDFARMEGAARMMAMPIHPEKYDPSLDHVYTHNLARSRTMNLNGVRGDVSRTEPHRSEARGTE